MQTLANSASLVLSAVVACISLNAEIAISVTLPLIPVLLVTSLLVCFVTSGRLLSAFMTISDKECTTPGAYTENDQNASFPPEAHVLADMPLLDAAFPRRTGRVRNRSQLFS